MKAALIARSYLGISGWRHPRKKGEAAALTLLKSEEKEEMAAEKQKENEAGRGEGDIACAVSLQKAARGRRAMAEVAWPVND